MTLISRFRRNSEKSLPSADNGHPETEHVHIPPAEQLNYCRTLHVENQRPPDAAATAKAWKLLEEQMALVPEGEVALIATDPGSMESRPCEAPTDLAWVQSFYLDRHCVTNAEFAQFVADGGYAQEHLWPAEILAHVLQFVDQSGCAGPRYWSGAQPPLGKYDHPVVGICWYEANAYAHWRGKRLPTPADWQRAATWASGEMSTGTQSRYPWGDSFDPSRCNTWNTGSGDTVPADDYYSGATPNGVYQLIGNVWEWTASLFECENSPEGDRLLMEAPMAEIRGGAYDTYFASQATSQFRTGQSLLFRGPNLGFRCCVNVDQLVPSPDPYSFLEGSGNS